MVDIIVKQMYDKEPYTKCIINIFLSLSFFAHVLITMHCSCQNDSQRMIIFHLQRQIFEICKYS